MTLLKWKVWRKQKIQDEIFQQANILWLNKKDDRRKYSTRGQTLIAQFIEVKG